MISTQIDQLEKLAKLKERGVLSDTEFEHQKKLILDIPESNNVQLDIDVSKFDKKEIDILGFTKGSRTQELKNQKKKKEKKGWVFLSFEDTGINSKAIFLVPKELRKKWIQRHPFLSSYIAIFLLILGFRSLLDDKNKKTNPEQSVETEEIYINKSMSNIEEEKRLVVDFIGNFESEIARLEEAYTPLRKEYEQTVNLSRTGEKSLHDLFNITKKCHKAAKYVWHKSKDIEIKENLPEEYRNLFKQALINIEMAYYMNKYGYEKILEFLDEQKPSIANEAKEAFESSQSYIIKYAINITEAKQNVGLFDPEKKDVDKNSSGNPSFNS